MYWDVAFHSRFAYDVEGRPNALVIYVKMWIYSNDTGAAADILQDELRLGVGWASGKSVARIIEEITNTVHEWAKYYTPQHNTRASYRADTCRVKPSFAEVARFHRPSNYGQNYQIGEIPRGVFV